MQPTRVFPFLFVLLLVQGAMAQQGAAPVVTCPLVLPTTLSRNSEEIPQVKCACPITIFQGKIYGRMGQEVFSTDDVAQFPSALLRSEQVAEGTYMWVVEYTAMENAEAVPLKATGYINVL
jgi:hypothetical protein